ncbi:heavy metal translocating P-type ATPase, partial [Klebsiella michiganensis]
SGLSRCAKRGVLVKGGGALERLALADTLFFDKTGTLTSGFARLVDVECAPHYASDVVLGLAGSIAQASNHVTAEAVAKAAREQGAKLRLPSGVVESPGAGVCGRVDGHVVSIGSFPYVLGSSAEPSWVAAFAKRVSYAGASAVFVGVHGELV